MGALGSIFPHLEVASWASLGRYLVAPGTSLGASGLLFGTLGLPLETPGRFGIDLGPPLGAIWLPLGPLWELLGSSSAPSGSLWELQQLQDLTEQL